MSMTNFEALLMITFLVTFFVGPLFYMICIVSKIHKEDEKLMKNGRRSPPRLK